MAIPPPLPPRRPGSDRKVVPPPSSLSGDLLSRPKPPAVPPAVNPPVPPAPAKKMPPVGHKAFSRATIDGRGGAVDRKGAGETEVPAFDSGFGDLPESLDAAPPRPRRKSHTKRNALVITFGIVALGACAFLFYSATRISFTPPPGGGTERKVGDGVDFLNYDRETRIADLQYEFPQMVSAGHTQLQALDKFKLVQVTGGEHEWLFIFQGSGLRNALQGIPMADDMVPNMPIGTPYAIQQFEHTRAGRAGIKNKPYWLRITSPNQDPYATPKRPDVEEPVSFPSYRKALESESWRQKFTFVIQAGSADVYVARVAHPHDVGSKVRASMFIDDVITRPRSIHHAPGIIALMLASEQYPTPPAWLDWLEKMATRSVEDHISESDPVQQEPAHSLLTARAGKVRSDAALALAVLSDYQRIDPAVAILPHAPDGHAATLVSLANSRSIERREGDRLDEIIAALPANYRSLMVPKPLVSPEERLAELLKQLDEASLESVDQREPLIEAVDMLFTVMNSEASARFGVAEARKKLALRVLTALGDMMQLKEPELWVSTLRYLDPARHLSFMVDYCQSPAAATGRQMPAWASNELGLLYRAARTKPQFMRDDIRRIAGIVYDPVNKSRAHSLLLPIITQFELDPQASLLIKEMRNRHTIRTDPVGTGNRLRSLVQNSSPASLAELKQMLDAGVDVNQYSTAGDGSRTHGSTLLHSAIEARNTAAAKLLIERGADINFQVFSKRSPLTWALIQNNQEMVAFLIGKGARISTTPLAKPTALTDEMPDLHLAVKRRNLTAVQLLLKHGADVNAASKPGEIPQVTPLDLAVMDRQSPIASELRIAGGKHGTSIDPHYMWMQEEVVRGNLAGIEQWASAGGKFSLPIHRSDLVAVAFSSPQRVRTVDRLLELGAPIILRSFFQLEKENRQDVIEIYRKHASARAQNGTGNPLAIVDIMRGNVAQLKAMLDGGYDVNQDVDGSGIRPLHVAVMEKNAAAVKLLLDRGADKEAKFGERTSIYLAVESQHIESAELLLKSGASINRSAPFLSPLLYYTVTTRNVGMAKLILAHGGSPDEPIMQGTTRTIFDAAISSGQEPLITLLASAPAATGSESDRNRRLFLAAVVAGKIEDMNRLAPSKFDPAANPGDPLLLLAITAKAPAKSIIRLIQLRVPITNEAYLYAERLKYSEMTTLLATEANKLSGNPVGNPLRLIEVIRKGPVQLKAEIDGGLDLKAPLDVAGWTPLHLAAALGNADAIRLLIRSGASVRALDKMGRLPQALLQFSGSPQLMQDLHNSFRELPRQ